MSKLSVANKRPSTERQMKLLSLIPLVVLLLLLVLAVLQSVDRMRILSDFLTVVDSRAVGGPLRRTINENFDALILGEPTASLQTSVLIKRIIASRDDYDFGRFSGVIRAQADNAIEAEGLLNEAHAEFRATGSVSDDTRIALETALKKLYLAAMQANTSFHVEKLPIENAKYAFMQAWQVQVAITRLRRQVVLALRDGGMTRDSALEFLQQHDRAEQSIQLLESMSRSIDWLRARSFASNYAGLARTFLDQPLIRHLHNRTARSALAAGDGPLRTSAFQPPAAGDWYRAQLPTEMEWESEFLNALGTAQAEARMIILQQVILYGSVLVLLLAAIAFSWRKSRLFGRTLVNDVVDMKATLGKMNTDNELLLSVREQSTQEISEIVEGVNELVRKLRSHDREIRALLAESRDREEELAVQAEEIETSNEELTMQAAELERANRQIREHAAEMEQANQYKSEFLANMSHELRTPLNSILVLSSLIAKDEGNYLSEDDLEGVEVIHEAGTSLLSLINDILDLSKIEAGKMQTAITTFSVRALAEALDRRYRPVALAQNLKLVTEVDQLVPGNIVSDDRFLMQIITNLISNALKFTEQGEIQLRYRYCPEEDLLTVSVCDTGPGIPVEKQDRVFNAFEQVDGSVNRKYGGTGLGLNLAKKMAVLLGGDLTLESTPGAGSTFTLTVPASGCTQSSAEEPTVHPAPPAYPLSAPVQSADAARLLSGRRILVFDDDERFTQLLRRACEPAGVELIGQLHAMDCVEMLESTDADVVVMDVMMPEKDGLTAIREIRAHQRFRDLPIIAHSAKNMPIDRNACLTAGANAYVEKSPETAPLLRAILEALREPKAAA